MTATPNRNLTIALWVFKGLLAIVFLWAASAKLLGQPRMVEEYEIIGLGQWFRYVSGLIEVTGAVLLLVPLTSFYGAMLLLGICGGAFIAQLFVLHNDLIHVIVMGLLLAVIAWFARPAWLMRIVRQLTGAN